MPSLKSITSAFCFCLLMTFCVASAKADTTYTYTYTGGQFTEFGEASCPPECNITGSFTLPTPLPPNAAVDLPADAPFAFSVGPLTATNLLDGPIPISTNAAGAIVGWFIFVGGGGGFAILTTTQRGDEFEFDSPDHVAFGADGPNGSWTVSTTGTNVPEPASQTLLIAGLVLAGLALKKSL